MNEQPWMPYVNLLEEAETDQLLLVTSVYIATELIFGMIDHAN